jgi:hypothetical protein
MPAQGPTWADSGRDRAATGHHDSQQSGRVDGGPYQDKAYSERGRGAPRHETREPGRPGRDGEGRPGHPTTDTATSHTPVLGRRVIPVRPPLYTVTMRLTD